MTQPDAPEFATDEEMEANIRPLVNDILDRFNADGLSPAQAGLVILALTYRLMEVMHDDPEARRFFILTLVNLINNYLAEDMNQPGACSSPDNEAGQ